MASYRAGNISTASPVWKTLTTDKGLLTIVKYGLPLQFASVPSPRGPFCYKLSAHDVALVHQEVTSLITKGVVVETDIQPGDFFSPVFPTVNKDGSCRLILNLKSLNHHVEHIHFKMENFDNVLHMVTPNCWMASVDLKSAFYSVPIHTTEI